MGTPHRLSLIALSGQIQFCATRHHPDVRISLLTASILSFVDLIAHGQTKNPAYIAVSRVWKFYDSSFTCLPPVYPTRVLDSHTSWIVQGRTHNSTGYDVSHRRLPSSAKS